MTGCQVLVPIVYGLLLAIPATIAYGQRSDDSLEDGFRALRAGEFAQARRIFSSAVKQSPTADNFGYLAMEEASLEDWPQAINDFQHSIRLGNDSAPAPCNLGITCLKSGQAEEGIRELRLALAKDPNYQQPSYALAVPLLELGRPRGALPYLQQLRKMSPQEAAIWVSLARAQFELGNSVAALRVCDEAMATVREFPGLAVRLVNLCLEHVQVERARRLLKNADDLSPGSAEIKLALAKVAPQVGDPKEALAALQGVSAGVGPPGEEKVLRGKAHALIGNFTAAESDHSAAMEADPRNVSYVVAYA